MRGGGEGRRGGSGKEKWEGKGMKVKRKEMRSRIKMRKTRGGTWVKMGIGAPSLSLHRNFCIQVHFIRTLTNTTFHTSKFIKMTKTIMCSNQILAYYIML